MRGLNPAEAAVLRRMCSTGPDHFIEGDDETEVRDRLVAQGRVMTWEGAENGYTFQAWRITARGRLALACATVVA